MRQLALKKKESRLLWQILMRGILVTDRMNKKAVATDQDDYRKLRQQLIGAWRSGIICLRYQRNDRHVAPFR